MPSPLLMATSLAGPRGEPSAVDAALRWLARPDDPQLRLLLALCAGAALLGLVDRWLARRRPGSPAPAEPAEPAEPATAVESRENAAPPAAP
ncbi:MAG: hypothetical protein KC486_14025 [Myxococcales bacterium]|nr:hypothetical protein [Myxococcales bacterium]